MLTFVTYGFGQLALLVAFGLVQATLVDPGDVQGGPVPSGVGQTAIVDPGAV